MAVGPLVSEVCFTFVLAAVLLHRYGNFSQHPLLVTVSVFVAWYFSFTIIFILPLDVSTTAYRQCLYDFLDPDPVTNSSVASNSSPPLHAVCVRPWSFVPEGVLQSLWRVVYWTSQALTWLILPLMQSYSTAGEFTIAGKLRRALIENAIYYGSYLLIFGVLLVYLALQPGMNLDASPASAGAPKRTTSKLSMLPCMLVLEGFCGHLTDAVKRALGDGKTDLAVIPGGMTSTLQSINVVLNKPFKDRVRLEYQKAKLKVVCVSASNTWGLFLLVLLLGHGLVEVPRSLWHRAQPGHALCRTYFRAAKLSLEGAEAQERLDDLLQVKCSFVGLRSFFDRHLHPSAVSAADIRPF
ncbi:hypothetical protein HPB51_020832 [Rhipicephalus microplus]|uniref:Uncharacterized protein n=1 Tax=Rhipicephalus microplus TaxID=6941 RepID=A0A9J6EBW3_RHIMP|nr:hypothetical protein HPB51_020832 [Rhipicephalus microplus]